MNTAVAGVEVVEGHSIKCVKVAELIIHQGYGIAHVDGTAVELSGIRADLSISFGVLAKNPGDKKPKSVLGGMFHCGPRRPLLAKFDFFHPWNKGKWLLSVYGRDNLGEIVSLAQKISQEFLVGVVVELVSEGGKRETLPND